MEDEKIIDLYWNRNESAIRETQQKYGALLHSIAYNILKNHADCEECENDTYQAVWNQIPPTKPKCLPAFLGRIIRNIALDRHDYYSAAKRNTEFETVLDELAGVIPAKESVEAQYEQTELSQLINGYLRGLKHEKRTVFVKRYWYAQSIAQIAQQSGFSESKIKSLLARTRKELKKYLEGQGVSL